MAALAIIRDVCRARPNGYRFMKKYKSGHWDGYISLIDKMNRFPTGLLPMVRMALEEKGYRLNLISNGKELYPTSVSPDFLQGITLRDYQLEAIQQLLFAKRGVAWMATGSGKTEVMAALIKALGYPQTLVLVHLKDLMYQTAERFRERLNCPIGLIGDGNFSQERIIVAMIQTLANRLPDMNLLGYQLVIVDECHHTSSDQMMDILYQIPGAYRYGFSGTPLKNDVLSDLKLISITGEVICEVRNKDLIEEGYSAIPTVKILTVESSKDSDYNAKYKDAYKKLIVMNKERNRLIRKVALEAQGTVLILVNFVTHGMILKNLIPGATFVHGSDDSTYRQEILQQMRSQSGVFIASPIFDEGVDVPRIDTVIIAGGGKSRVKLLQRIGRGLRKKEGDNNLIIYDFIDDTNKYLLRHSKARIVTYVAEGFRTTVIS